MSFQAAGWALQQQTVTDPHARHLLLVLASYADKEGRSAFPSIDSLIEDTGLSRRTIYSKIELLLDLGLIVRGDQAVVAGHIKRADKRPVCYDMCMSTAPTPRGAAHAPRAPANATDARGATDAPREPSKESDSRGAANAPGGATGCGSQPNGVQLTQERGAFDVVTGCDTCTQSVIKHPKEQSVETRARGTRLPDDWILSKRLATWALSRQPTWTPEHCRRVGEKFANYWRSVPGKAGRKLDWNATWCVWVDNEGPMRAAGAAGASATVVSGEWWEKTTGIEEKGAELGVPRGDDSFFHFKCRVFLAAGRGPWIDAILKWARRSGHEYYAEACEFFAAVLPEDFHA